LGVASVREGAVLVREDDHVSVTDDQQVADLLPDGPMALLVLVDPGVAPEPQEGVSAKAREVSL